MAVFSRLQRQPQGNAWLERPRGEKNNKSIAEGDAALTQQRFRIFFFSECPTCEATKCTNLCQLPKTKSNSPNVCISFGVWRCSAQETSSQKVELTVLAPAGWICSALNRKHRVQCVTQGRYRGCRVEEQKEKITNKHKININENRPIKVQNPNS